MRRPPLLLSLLPLLALPLLSCGLEEAIVSGAVHDEHVRVPPPAPVFVRGRATQTAGGTAFLWSGAQRIDTTASISGTGDFAFEFAGTAAQVGLVLEARQGSTQRLGLVPEVPKQQSVLDPPIDLDLATLSPALSDLGADATTLSLIITAKALDEGLGLASLSVKATSGAMETLRPALRTDGAVRVVAQQVARILAAGDALGGSLAPFAPGAPRTEGLLSADFLAASPLDIDGDGAADPTSAPFVAALRAAAASFQFAACFPPDRIRVVFQLQLASGLADANCNPIDPFKWARQEEGRAVFLTGGVHQDSARCPTDQPESGCLTQDQIVAINTMMGNWVPNKVRLFDDGAHGDGAAGDGLWAVAFDMPYIPFPASDPAGAGLRLGYKYTYGFGGQGWTTTEEWPGNSRLLEVVDLNGDRMVIRRDIFGDETRNKDKANQLSPARGGCGFVTWEAEKVGTCATDTRENLYDPSGGCEPSTWPNASGVAPVTIPCADAP